MSRIFKNRYQAQKARKTEPFFSGTEGGYENDKLITSV